MDNDENERQENSEAEDNDGGQLVHQVISAGKDGKGDEERMFPFEVQDFAFSTLSVVGEAEHQTHKSQSEHHFMGVKEGDEKKDDETCQEVVGLIVEQVVDQPIEPSLGILHIRNLEP